jgi:hypothetical protein
MHDRRVHSLAILAVLLALHLAAQAQAQTAPPPQSTSLTLVGQPGEAPVVQVNGKSYVEIESLARITHGSLRFQGSQIVLTLPGASSASAASAPQPPKTPQLSQAFSSAEIEALTQIREWRAALVNAIENNYPVADSWVARLRRSAEAKVQLAIAAATTDPDQKTALLLQTELTNMQQMSDQFVAMHTTANYIPPDSFEHNSLDEKILACSRALATMAATKQYADEISCH